MKFKNSNGEWQNVKISNYGIEQTPIGSMIYYPSQTIPQGYLVCDGREVLIADYPLLFNAIGYIGGDNVATGYFRLPDMQGIVPAGYCAEIDNSSPLSGDFGETVGDSTHTLTTSEMPSHSHKVEKVATFGHSSGVNFGATGDWQGQGSIQTVASGGGQPHSIVQPTKLYHWLIKAKNMVTLGGYTEDFNVDGSLNVKGDLKFNDVHLNDLMNDIVGDTVPIGAVIEWDNDTIPDNWLLLDGRAVSRTEYKELFALYGTRYGAGDGSTTFNLPNRKTRVSVGKDSSDSDFNTLGKTGGEKKHTLTVAEMPSHQHSIGFDQSASGGTEWLKSGGNSGGPYWSEQYCSSRGGDQPHNNLQPYIVTNFIVKAKQSAGLVANVIDNLNSTSEVDALSANQGRILAQKNIMTIKSDRHTQTFPSSWTQYTITNMSVYEYIGNKLTFDSSNNAIKIGKNVSKVKVSANMSWSNSQSWDRIMHVFRNDTEITASYYGQAPNKYLPYSLSSILIAVQENDLIKLCANIGTSNSESEILSAWLTVEVVE